MAVHKVPQDVEAEDKLVGPFSFRQFIYLLVAAAFGGLSWLLLTAPPPFPFFIAITAPVIIGLLALALPLRKDQPMEIYLAAMVRFYLKPKRRLWSTDGVASGVIINAPRVVEEHLTKEITQEEAEDKLAYLAKIVDTHGWAAKGVDIPEAPAVNYAIIQEAENTEDRMDDHAGIAKSFDALLAKQKEESRSAARERMSQLAQQAPAPDSYPQTQQYNAAPIPQMSAMMAPQPATYPQDTPAPLTSPTQQPQQYNAMPSVNGQSMPHFNPYPTMHQRVLSPESIQAPAQIQQSMPVSQQSTPVRKENNVAPPQPRGDSKLRDVPLPQSIRPGESGIPAALQPQTYNAAAQKAMTPQVSPDIIRLAHNTDLSIQAIAHEAHRTLDEEEPGEVVISLR